MIGRLVSISLFTIIATFTVLFWIERLRAYKPHSTNASTEGFADIGSDKVLSDEQLAKLIHMREPVPTPEEAVAAHQTLLRFIRNDFSQGIKFVTDFRRRFYDDDPPFRQDLDIRRLMENYNSPLSLAG